MPVLHIGTGPDPSLAWLLYLLVAFLLAIIIVGAIVDARVFDEGAPGPLGEARRVRMADEKATAEKRRVE